MRLLFFGDIHFSLRAPEQRKENYASLILEKISYIQKAAKKLNSDVLVCTADFFHRKGMHSDSILELNLIMEAIDIPIYAILGNHDLTGYQMDSERGKQIGSLIRAGKVILLDKAKEFDDCILGGVSYRNDYNSKETFEYKFKESEKINVLVTHATLFKRKPVFDGYVLLDDLKKMDITADIIVNGHIHNPEFMEETIKTKHRMIKVFQLGSICRERIELQDWQPRILQIDIDGEDEETKWFKIPVENDVWDFSKENQFEKQDTEKMKKFVQDLAKEGGVDETSVDALISKAIKKLGYTGLREEIQQTISMLMKQDKVNQ